MYGNRYKRVNRDVRLTHGKFTDALKIPQYAGFAQPPGRDQIGDEPGMEGDIIVDRLTGRFCWHDGITWQCVDGSGIGLVNEHFLLFGIQTAGIGSVLPGEILPAFTFDVLQPGTPPLHGYTILGAVPASIAVAPASNAINITAPLITGGIVPYGMRNISVNQTCTIMMDVILTMDTSDIGQTNRVVFNYAINNGGGYALPSPVANSAPYSEYLVDTYFTDSGRAAYTLSVSMRGLVTLLPGHSVAVVAAGYDAPFTGTPIIIRTAKIHGEIYERS